MEGLPPWAVVMNCELSDSLLRLPIGVCLAAVMAMLWVLPR